ncbi:MAG: DUF2169 domain-containing protein [Sandaracinaceae bacterium]|nr:DUF2169 domain-containing protein [Sandaracinaceae bacterium]
MELIKQSPFEVGWIAWQFAPGEARLVVAVKATFDLVPEGPCRLAADQTPVTGDEPWDDDVDASTRYDSDMALLKPCGEWWLTGTLRRREPTTELACRGRIGEIETRFSVIGDRWWEPAGGMSAPVPFTSMPLRWERCFGGPDLPENPLGAGIARDPADERGRLRLPNIERADRLVRSPDERPEPAGAWPLPRRYASRMKHLGTYDGAYVRDHWPYFPPDMSYAHFLAAPEPQRLASGYWRGDEEIELWELHPEHAVVRCRLPGLRPRAFVHREDRPDGPLDEIGLVLDTISVDADVGRAHSVWRGSLPCRDEALSGFRHLFVIHEEIGASQSPAEYFASFVGALAARIEEDRGFEPEEPREDVTPEPEPEDAPREAMPTVEALLDAHRAHARELGWSEEVIETLYPVTRAPGPPDERRASLEQALALAEQLALPEVAREGLRSAIENLSAPSEEPKRRKKRKPPPAGLFTPQELRDEVIRRLAADEPIAGLDLSDADLSLMNLSGVDLSGALLLRADLRQATLDGARLDGATLDEAKLGGATLRGASLVGASASLIEADGVDFTSAVLEGVFAERAKLAGAIFRGAKASRAYLEECNAERADFEGASLEEADFPYTNLDGANLRDAGLADARLDGATLRHAVLDRIRGAKLRASDADFTGASFHGAALPEAAFADSMLAGARLTEADLTRAIFEKARLDGAELLAVRARSACFSGASLVGASLHGADLLGARFDGATLRNADLRGASAYQAEFWRADVDGVRFDGANLAETKLA